MKNITDRMNVYSNGVIKFAYTVMSGKSNTDCLHTREGENP